MNQIPHHPDYLYTKAEQALALWLEHVGKDHDVFLVRHLFPPVEECRSSETPPECLEWWNVNGVSILIHHYGNHNGFQSYIPAHPTANSIRSELEGICRVCDVDPATIDDLP